MNQTEKHSQRVLNDLKHKGFHEGWYNKDQVINILKHLLPINITVNRVRPDTRPKYYIYRFTTRG